MAKIFAVCNQKGGVGKSTTTFQLARAAVRLGRKVLLVDADPQGNLTSVASKEVFEEDQVGLADVLSSRTPETIADVIVAGVWQGLDVVGTNGGALAAVRDELVIAGVGREKRLAEALKAVRDDYDLIFIDCAPSLDQLTINALTAADSVLVVTHAKLWSSNGLKQLLETVDGVRDYCNPNLAIAGIIVNQHEEKTVSGRTWLHELNQAATALGLNVFDPAIPKRVIISDATEAALGVDQWAGGEKELSELYESHLKNLERSLS